jgi:hypothetical protein
VALSTRLREAAILHLHSERRPCCGVLCFLRADLDLCVQALVPAAGGWPAYFARAATAYGIFGVLFAFVIAYAAYGFTLAAAAVLIKWILVGRVKAGVHKYAYPEALCVMCRRCHYGTL